MRKESIMKYILIGLAIVARVSGQIYTQIQEDGYHYDTPALDVRLSLPTQERNVPLPVKPQTRQPTVTLPPLPAFVPQINLPKVLPVKPSSQPLPVKPVVPETIPTLPPLPSFVPQINLPKVIPVKPASQPLPVKPVVPETIPTLPPLPSFVPQINLPKVLPVKPAPEVRKPAPFITAKIDSVANNELLPPITNDYLPPIDNDYLPPFEDETNWDLWKKKFSKRYADQDEDEYRESIFDDNVKFVMDHNADFAKGKVSFDCAVNKFADLTTEEFILVNTGLRLKGRTAAQSPTNFYESPFGGSPHEQEEEDFDIRTSGFNVGFDTGSSDFGNVNDTSRSGFSSGSGFTSFSSSQKSPTSSFSSSPRNGQGQAKMNIFMTSSMLEKEVKDEVDWRKEGAITPVKNQGKCASCWAFSANGALEAHNFLRKKTGPIPLSEQNLIDCVKENDGCDGGYMTNAYIYAERNPGVDKEATYPYEAKQSKCRFTRANVGGECMTHMEIQIGNEKALEQAVAAVGPVSAGIDGGQRSFQFYNSGYYYEPKCSQDVNHAVLIVGYGKSENGEEYWICKNSWDTDWGEEGYIRMAKKKNNNCGIANLASYPIV